MISIKNLNSYSFSLGKNIGFLPLFFMLIIFPKLLVAQDVAEEQVVQESSTIEAPNLSELIPKASELSNRLLIMEGSLSDIVDVSLIESQYSEIGKHLVLFTKKLNDLKKDENRSFNEFAKLREEIDTERQIFDKFNGPVTSAIVQLDELRSQWLAEKNKWGVYKDLLLKEELPNQVQSILKDINLTIDTSLGVIDKELIVLLKLQETGYKNQSVINVLESNITVLFQKDRLNAFEDASTPIFSISFFRQLNGSLWSKFKKGFKTIIYPSAEFLSKVWVLILLQILISVFVVFLIRKNKEALLKNKRYAFFTNRAVSSGLFFGSISVFVIYMYNNTPQLWYLLLAIVAGVSFCRMIDNSSIEAWKKRILYISIGVIILFGIFDIITFPVPLFRIFLVSITIYGLFKLFKLIKKLKSEEIKPIYKWSLYFITSYLFVVLFSEVIGKEILALYMYESLLKTVINIVLIMVFLLMIRAAVEVIFKKLIEKNSSAPTNHIEKSVARVSIIINTLVILFFLMPRILVIWGFYENLPEANSFLTSLGVNFGDVKITLEVLVLSISILYGSYILSSIIEMVIMNDSLEKYDLDKGTRLSIAQLIRYFLLFFGFLLAIAALGFDLTSFTIVLSALGVGIGFGLQGIVNNLVSGLILLFERPVREGDSIQVGGVWCNIKKIGLRATRVITVDQADLIVPNADLVNNQVINWTLTNRRMMVRIEVGVAYGSDVPLVIATLIEVAEKHRSLIKSSKPVVLFQSFGDSTLNFELRAWAKEADKGLSVKSELRQEIDKKFREENIEIAFPQQDLHIRSIDKSIKFK